MLDICGEFGLLGKVRAAFDPANSELGKIGLSRGVPKRVRKVQDAPPEEWRNNMNWYESSFVYQIYPLGLCGAPWSNDGSTEGATNDDDHRLLRLVSDGWVEHVSKLGATCVMLNPVFESDAHGYDTRDYMRVDSRLGTNDDLKTVVDAFHKLRDRKSVV